MELDHVDVPRAQPGLTVRGLGGPLGGQGAREVALVVQAHRVAGLRGPEDPDRPPGPTGHVLGGDHHRRGAVGERAAVVELEGVGHLRALHDLLDRDLLLELRLGVEGAVTMVLHGHVRHLLLGRPVLGHVGAGDEREDPREGEAGRLLEDGVRRVGEHLGGAVGRHGEDALGAPDEEDVGRARRDLEERVAEGGVARGAGGLEPGRGHGGDAEGARDLRSHVELTLPGLAHDVPEVDPRHLARADVGVAEGVDGGLGEELRARPLVLAELRHADADDGDLAHGSSLLEL